MFLILKKMMFFALDNKLFEIKLDKNKETD